MMTNPKIFLMTLVGAAAAFTALVSFTPDAKAQSYGDYCREYTRTVTIGNRREEAYGTACLRPDGQWEIMNEGSLRPASYNTYVPNRTVIVQQPTQIVYRDRAPTRVFFFGPTRPATYYYKSHKKHYAKPHPVHHRHPGRGHGRHHHHR